MTAAKGFQELFRMARKGIKKDMDRAACEMTALSSNARIQSILDRRNPTASQAIPPSGSQEVVQLGKSLPTLRMRLAFRAACLQRHSAFSPLG